MKKKNVSSFEDIQTLKSINNNLVISKKKKYKLYNLIITTFLIISFIITFYLIKKLNNFEANVNDKIKNLYNIIKYQINLINNQENKIKLFDFHNFSLNQQIEAIFSYIINIKNTSNIYQILRPKGVLGKQKVRVGAKNDGGYVLLNDFKNIKIAYSFGIGNEISFDKELADKNIDIFMYDHTIKELPFIHPKFHWKKIGLSEKKVENNNMKSFNEIITENGHINEKNMILKMDIEGAEWKIFKNLDPEIIIKFKYIIVEFHFYNKAISDCLEVLKKINQTHQIFRLHCNNCCSFVNLDGYNICSSLEISYIIRENNIFIKSSDFFPVKNIDAKNIINREEINLFLNMYQFENIFPVK